MSAHPRSSPPSVRFWDSRRNTIGVILAIGAAVFTLAISIWPIAVPQAQGPVGVVWGLAAKFLGLLYIAAFFLADRRWATARWLLIAGGVGQILIGIVSGLSYGTIAGPEGRLVGLFDVAPGILAIAAAFFIGPPPRRAGLPEDRSEPLAPEVKQHLPFGHDDDHSRRREDEDRREVPASAGRTATSADVMGYTPSDADRSTQVEPGMYVVTSDGMEVGQVKEVRRADFLADRQDRGMLYIPHDVVRAVQADRVLLDVAGGQLDSMGWEQPDLATLGQPGP